MVDVSLTRCHWCQGRDLYVAYHDGEWGVPVADDKALFERLVLEGMQAGLSWWTVLSKRAHMQEVFYQFDPEQLARAGAEDVSRWLSDPGLIRHRGKLQAMVTNARCMLETPEFAAWLWSFAPRRAQVYTSAREVPAETQESRTMAKALKKAGFRFVGPTTCYAFMQSVGMVNDHLIDCWRHDRCAALPPPAFGGTVHSA